VTFNVLNRIGSWKLVLLGCLCLGQVSWIAMPALAGALKVEIIDESRAATPARVYLTSTQEQAYVPRGCKRGRDDCGLSTTYRRAYSAPHRLRYQKWSQWRSGQNFVPFRGVFQIDLSAGAYDPTIEPGKEYLPATERMTVPTEGAVTRLIQLKRWVRMTDLGWSSGGIHTHIALRDLAPMIRAEDLNVALPITLWCRPGQPVWRDPDLEKCLESANAEGRVRIDERHAYSCTNEELEVLNSPLLVSRLDRSLLLLECPYVDFGRSAHGRARRLREGQFS
jgi:hypothetical protein